MRFAELMHLSVSIIVDRNETELETCSVDLLDEPLEFIGFVDTTYYLNYFDQSLSARFFALYFCVELRMLISLKLILSKIGLFGTQKSNNLIRLKKGDKSVKIFSFFLGTDISVIMPAFTA